MTARLPDSRNRKDRDHAVTDANDHDQNHVNKCGEIFLAPKLDQ